MAAGTDRGVSGADPGNLGLYQSLFCKKVIDATKAELKRNGFLQMRAFVAKTFPAYTFEMLDRMPMERVVQLYATAVWVAEEEKKWVKTNTPRR